MRKKEPTADGDATGAYPAQYDPEEELAPQRQSFVRVRTASPVNDAAPRRREPYQAYDATYGAEPPTLRIAPSSSRAPANVFREMLANDHLNFTVNVLHLRRLVGDGRAEAARVVVDRLGELEDVRDAVDGLFALPIERTARLFAPDAPLSTYLRGVFLFCERLVDAFEELLAAPKPNWRALQMRIADATQFHFDGLAETVREELAASLRDVEAAARVEELFFAAAYLRAKVCAIA